MTREDLEVLVNKLASGQYTHIWDSAENRKYGSKISPSDIKVERSGGYPTNLSIKNRLTNIKVPLEKVIDFAQTSINFSIILRQQGTTTNRRVVFSHAK